MKYYVEYPDDMPREIASMVLKNMKRYDNLLSLNLLQITEIEELVREVVEYKLSKSLIGEGEKGD